MFSKRRAAWSGLASIFIFAAQLAAQTVTETTAVPTGSASLGALALSAAGAPPPDQPPQGRVMPNPRRPPGAAPLSSQQAAAALTIPAPPVLPVTGPDPNLFGFLGLSTITNVTANGGFTFEPPDQGMAVGNGFVLEAVNLQLAVFDATSGNRLTAPVALNAFFHLAPFFDPVTKLFGPYITDPKCYFDPDLRRWFITVAEIDVNPQTGALLGQSHVLIAVSQTENLLGSYNLFAINTTDDGTGGTQVHFGCPCFGDQPLIGADRNGFFISTNEFNIFGSETIFNGANIYAMSKQNLAAGALTTALHFSGIPLAEGIAYSVQPATSPDFSRETGAGVEYFMSALDFTGTLDNRIAVWAMTNTQALSNLHPTNVQLLSTVVTSEVYGQPPPALQPPPLPGFTLLNNHGNLELLDTNDDRMNQVVFANGFLWSGVNTVIRGSGGIRAGTAWFVVNPTLRSGQLSATIRRQGYIAVAGDSTIFPSIGVTSSGRAAIVFTLVGPAGTPVFPFGFYPSVAYSTLAANASPTAVRVAASGQAPDDSFAADGNGVTRWGDYTAAVADGDAVWIAGELIPPGPRLRISNWGTFMGRVFP
jgi:hypothetical protein